jgi:nucleotide-sensitive chloride channel 1A
MEVLREAPNASTFIPLSEHQSATPASFYSGPPVLHYHSGRCKVVILERDLNLSPALTALAREAEKTSATAEPVTNGNGEQGEEEDGPVEQKVLGDVDVWVTSESATFPRMATLSRKFADTCPIASFSCIPHLPRPVSPYRIPLFRSTQSSRCLSR